MITLPITGITTSNTSTKIPTRQNMATGNALTAGLICGLDNTDSLVKVSDTSATPLTPLYVTAANSKAVGEGYESLVSILGADGVCEISVETGQTITAGDPVVLDGFGTIIAKPENAGAGPSYEAWLIGTAIESTTVTKRKIRINTRVPELVTILPEE